MQYAPAAQSDSPQATRDGGILRWRFSMTFHAHITCELMPNQRSAGTRLAKMKRPRHRTASLYEPFSVEAERRHITMEERDFFPAAVKTLQPEDWTEIASRLTDQKDPLFSGIVEESFDEVRRRIWRLERERRNGPEQERC